MVNACVTYVPFNTYNTIPVNLFIFLCVFGVTDSATAAQSFRAELVLFTIFDFLLYSETCL